MTDELHVFDEITDADSIAGIWGEDFRPFAGNARVHFTTDNIFVDLKEPVRTLDGKDSIRVEVREPNVSELRAADAAKGDISKSAKMLSALTGIPESEMNRMKASDFVLINRVIGAFLADGPETGERS